MSNLRPPSLDPVQVAAWWPQAEAVLAKRERGIKPTKETYAHFGKLARIRKGGIMHHQYPRPKADG